MTITAILIATGRLNHLSESVASFLHQTHKDKRLIIVNVCPRQSLSFDHPAVSIYNMKVQPVLPMRAKNYAVELAQDGVIVAWDEQSVYLPEFLSSIESSIAQQDWILFDKELCLDGQQTVQQLQGSELSFAFRRHAWEKAGRYQPGIHGTSDRNLIGKICQQFKGETIAIDPRSIQVLRIGNNDERANVTPAAKSGVIKLQPSLTLDYQALVIGALTESEERDVCFVELGRYGDIINLLPVLKVVADNHKPPLLMVSSKFADLLDGISYVRPFITQLSNEKLGEALKIARENFDFVICSQIWGEGWSQAKTMKHYNVESWKNSGMLHRFNDPALRPVFDKRDVAREKALIANVVQKDTRPLILVNASAAVSSPCPSCAGLMEEIKSMWGQDYNVVDLSQVRGERLFDLLGLMEQASCLVSIDTSLLHLVTATNCPVVAIVPSKADGWAATKVRCGNAVATLHYEEIFFDKSQKVHEAIAAAVERPNKKVTMSKAKLKRPARVFHLVDRFDDVDKKQLERKTHGWFTWDKMYEKSDLLPIHAWPHFYTRDARNTLGDSRSLPYFRDLLQFALGQIKSDDIILWTNDDNLLHPSIAEYVRFHVGSYGPCSFFRTEFRGAHWPSMKRRPETLAAWNREKHVGRDGFAFRASWLKEHLGEIPDVVLGAKMWDIHLACIIRLNYGIETTNKNIWEHILPAEGQNGLTCHLAHQSNWALPTHQESPSNQHNGRLFLEWATEHLPNLKVTPKGDLL